MLTYKSWPIECWDVSAAFLYAGLRDTNLRGNEIFTSPPKIFDEAGVVKPEKSGRLNKALYGLRTSPIAWETERDKTLKSLSWTQKGQENRLLPCSGLQG